MPWARASFKGQDVWVEVQTDGAPLVQRGTVGIRYQLSDTAKVYRGSLSNLTYQAGQGPVESLPASPGKAARGSGFGSAGSRTADQAAAAAVAARDLVASLPAGTHIAYADGACKGNPGPAGSGVHLHLADGRKVEASLSLGHETNNVGELRAIGLALDLLETAGVAPDEPVAVLSDSSYARGVLMQNWKAKANTELVLELRARLKGRRGVRMYWVAGHAGVVGNERADALANEGVAGRTAVRWL